MTSSNAARQPKPLTLDKAIKLACETMDKEIQRLAVDANLWERYGGPFHGKGASERRKQLREAKEILQKLNEHKSTPAS